MVEKDWQREHYRKGQTIERLFKEELYLSREDHIQSHFLTCFVSLVIARILEHRMKGKYSVGAMLESLGKCSCSHIQKNYYLFDYNDKILAEIGQEFNIDFGKKW